MKAVTYLSLIHISPRQRLAVVGMDSAPEKLLHIFTSLLYFTLSCSILYYVFRKARTVQQFAPGSDPHGLGAELVEQGLTVLLRHREQARRERVRHAGVGADYRDGAPSR